MNTMILWGWQDTPWGEQGTEALENGCGERERD